MTHTRQQIEVKVALGLPELYKEIDMSEGYVDISNLDGDIIELTPYEMIQNAARAIGLEVKSPKPSCKHCHGRGWTGLYAKDKSPIACKCIYPDVSEELKQSEEIRHFGPRNRKERRAF